MKLIGTEHVSDIPYVYITSESSIEIRLRTPKKQVKSVDLIYNDPYNYADGQWIEKTGSMKLSNRDDMYDWWSKEINIDSRRFLYSFKLHTFTDETMFYTESGLDTELNVMYQFNLPFSHAEEIFTYPKWIDETVWYQIFPDRFASSDSRKAEKWHTGDVTNECQYGGDIKGIISKLDYIKSLGANAIYFTPIFQADSSHKYDTTDYFKIDPQFGTEEDFKELIQKAHSHGIRVMLDGVFNHTSKNHPFFMDVVKNKQASRYKDWFYIKDYDNLEASLNLNDQAFRELDAYNAFAYTPNMPKLNVSNPQAREYILDAVAYWTKMGIDGWRLDVANEVCHDFWKDFNKLVTSINPEIYIVGEIWHDSIQWLRGDEFHAVMNYKYTNAIIDYFFKNTISTSKFENRIVRSLMQYTPMINKAAFNLFDSHDTMRVIDMCDYDLEKLKLGVLYLFTQVGSPCIYYGTEIGMTGQGDPNNRKLMIWDETEWNHDLLSFYKHVIKLRKEHPTLANHGELKFVKNDRLCEYIRFTDTEEYTVVLNNSNKIVDYQPHGEVISSHNYRSGIINPYGYIVSKRSIK